jgi:hypothetical protein
VVICATLISNAKILGSILFNVNLYFINTKYGALSEFNHRLGRVESIRSPSVFGPRIRAIRVIWPDSIRTQLGHGLPIKQDMHSNSVRVKSVSSTRTVHGIRGVRAESVRNRWPSVKTSSLAGLDRSLLIT